MGRKRLAKNRGLPPNLYQNSAGYFYFVNPRNKESKGLGRDKSKACSDARSANAALATLKPSSLVDWVTGKTSYTFAEWIPLYKEMWVSKTEPAANTLRNALSYLARMEGASFAWMALGEVGTAHVAGFLEKFQADTGAASALAMRARMQDVFRMAETQGLIEQGSNPVTATYTPSRVVKRERLTLEQFYAIREKAPAWLKRAMNLALLTAQRRDDLANLKFSDFKEGYLYIVQGKSQGAVKLQQDGAIKLSKVGMSIGEAVQNCRDLIVSRYMIHHIEHNGTAKPGDQLSSNGISNSFQTAREAAGITASEGRTPPTFHEIRSLAERLYKEEYGAAFAQAMLGHKNASMTARYDDLRGTAFQVISAK